MVRAWEIWMGKTDAYCWVKRSPRGFVRCELLKHPSNHYHVGRGRTGRWYKWKDKADAKKH